jgi:hypothetical protein
LPKAFGNGYARVPSGHVTQYEHSILGSRQNRVGPGVDVWRFVRGAVVCKELVVSVLVWTRYLPVQRRPWELSQRHRGRSHWIYTLASRLALKYPHCQEYVPYMCISQTRATFVAFISYSWLFGRREARQCAQHTPYALLLRPPGRLRGLTFP